MRVDIRVAEIPLFIVIGAVMEIGLYFLLAHALLGDVGKKAFFRLVPVNLGKCFIFPILRHKGTEKGDDLSHQLGGDLRQSRGKPGSAEEKSTTFFLGAINSPCSILRSS